MPMHVFDHGLHGYPDSTLDLAQPVVAPDLGLLVQVIPCGLELPDSLGLHVVGIGNLKVRSNAEFAAIARALPLGTLPNS